MNDSSRSIRRAIVWRFTVLFVRAFLAELATAGALGDSERERRGRRRRPPDLAARRTSRTARAVEADCRAERATRNAAARPHCDSESDANRPTRAARAVRREQRVARANDALEGSARNPHAILAALGAATAHSLPLHVPSAER